MYKFKESGLEFEFNQKYWGKVIQFDTDSNYINMQKIGNYEYNDAKKGKISFCGVKGVDFLGINQNSLVFIEVKNYNNNLSSKKLNNGADQLITEVALKIKDTIAGIVGAQINSTNDVKYWKTAFDYLKNNEKNKIILWLELKSKILSSKNRTINKAKRDMVSLNLDFKKKFAIKMKWFQPTKSNILILNLSTYSQYSLNFKVK